MTTQSETRAGKLPLQAAAEKARDLLRNIIRDKSGGVHYAAAQTACHQINQALAASEPVEAVAWADSDDPQQIHNVALCKGSWGCAVPLYLHPAPDQPGKGEACRFANCTCDLTHTTQPSDPAEGDARAFDLGFEWRQMLDGHVYDGRDVGRTMLAHIFDGLGVNASVIDGFDSKETAIVKAKAEIKRALSTPPTAAVSVDTIPRLDGNPPTYFVEGLGWVVPCSDAVKYVDLLRAEAAALDPQVKKQD